MPSTAVLSLLTAAVSGIGGTPRPGQIEMARAIGEAMDSGEHLLVQAGTGTGKSLAYLVPAAAHAQATGKPVVVATATLALQGQIIDRDLPRLARSLRPLLSRPLTYALLKGRRNYACVHKLHGGLPADDDALLSTGAVDEQAGRLGQEVLRAREWARDSDSGDRDDLVPGVSERAWQQVSVSARECLGSACPMRAECFAERARAGAGEADIVVTNHALAAIDAFEGRRLLPEHDVLVIDEAHELADRVTSTVTAELTAAAVTAAARKAGTHADSGDLAAAAEALGEALSATREGRVLRPSGQLVTAISRVSDSARLMLGSLKDSGTQAEAAEGARAQARAAVEEIHETTSRILAGRDLDVVWISQDERRGAVLRIAPMSVAMQLRESLFAERTVVLTSATLALGGSFGPVAGELGLRGEGAPAWRGLDAGSPFDYRAQGIVYVAAHLPAPGREGPAPEMLDELEALIRAAGGRALGLFSSMRMARLAAGEMRERLGGIEIWCQGEDQTPALVRRFASSAASCLFGTLSLWQGVDVPGPACQLVVIDRVPFPRPDDPLMSARSQAITSMGGNGFMAVSATSAALRLAQGAGRLIRRHDDRGVVAVLDPRLVTARYAGFLQASLPPMWPTTDREVVLGALRRLDESAGEVRPVAAPPSRAAGTGTAGRGTRPDGGQPAGAGPEGSAAPGGSRVFAAGPGDPGPAEADDWDEALDEELREGVELGLEPAEIADHLGVSAAAVTARAAALGL